VVVVSSFGLRFADYPAALPVLYSRFLANVADMSVKADPLVELRTAHDATVLARFPSLKARLASCGSAACGSASWVSPFGSCYAPSSASDSILMLRFVLLADTFSGPCHCGVGDAKDGLFLEHVLTCSKLRGANRTFRHNAVLAALDHSLRRFGLLTSVEPTFYIYADGSRKRPDLTCFVSPPVATDLTVTIDPTAALAEKVHKHSAAAFGRSHEFLPFAVGIFGELHQSLDAFLLRCFAGLLPSTRRLAILQSKRAVSEAWLTGTAAMIRSLSSPVSVLELELASGWAHA